MATLNLDTLLIFVQTPSNFKNFSQVYLKNNLKGSVGVH